MLMLLILSMIPQISRKIIGIFHMIRACNYVGKKLNFLKFNEVNRYIKSRYVYVNIVLKHSEIVLIFFLHITGFQKFF